ncbi:unnamed protein product [Adineta steineri]|uniref:Isochorismatase-like domain-containing protein n=1 Tax=Adineta steineri TaxID=433720 RepID=A0A813R859_9BILA|nr:unnamed protein product [Adineta steineri]CAF1211668.1 unnamed protein product [Adineta steineri]
MDLQAGIIGMLPNSEELLTQVATAISIARERDVQVGHVRVAFEDSDYAAIPNTNKTFSAVAGSRRMQIDTPDAAFHKNVAPQAGDIVVRKTRVGAFSTTDLDQQLRQRGITNLILAGVSTSGAVLSTVRDAADRDYQLYILVDGTADLDPEVHDILIKKVFPRQAYTITTAELGDLISGA